MAFKASECKDSQRVKFSSQLMKGKALIWWNLTHSSLSPRELAKLSWPIFKKKILDKYCSKRALAKIEAEFRRLEKWNLSVPDYLKLFLEKLSLAEHLVPEERMKIMAYRLGLPAMMGTTLKNAKVTSLQEAIEQSLRVEDTLAQARE